MFFTILLVFMAGVIIASVLLAMWCAFSREPDGVAGSFGLGAVVCVFPAMLIAFTWTDHAKNLAIISSQEPVVSVYQERVDALTKRLSDFEYPKSALVNADTPVAAIVASLSEAEGKLASAKAERALAMRSVEATRAGPMSGVIWFAGDYK